MGKAIQLETLASGGFIAVDLDDLIAMMKLAASQRGIDLTTNDQKREVLRGMGYEKYFPILKQETEFSWL